MRLCGGCPLQIWLEIDQQTGNDESCLPAIMNIRAVVDSEQKRKRVNATEGAYLELLEIELRDSAKQLEGDGGEAEAGGRNGRGRLSLDPGGRVGGQEGAVQHGDHPHQFGAVQRGHLQTERYRNYEEVLLEGPRAVPDGWGPGLRGSGRRGRRGAPGRPGGRRRPLGCRGPDHGPTRSIWPAARPLLRKPRSWKQREKLPLKTVKLYCYVCFVIVLFFVFVFF